MSIFYISKTKSDKIVLLHDDDLLLPNTLEDLNSLPYTENSKTLTPRASPAGYGVHTSHQELKFLAES